MSDSDTTSTVNSERESHLVGCSIKGPSHEKEGIPCQDAWAGTQFSNSRFVLAVADGLGSASHSHLGSEVAVKTVVTHLEELIRKENYDETVLKDGFKTAFKSVRSALQDEADRQEVSLSDLNTTLLVAAGGPSGVGAAAVGDGGVIRVYRDDFYLFVPREDSEYANRTTPIQSDRWQESYRFEYSENVDGVAAFSDGLENVAWEGRNSPQDALFDQFFNFVWYTNDTDHINNELAEFLNHERYRNISGDDKTVAIATLDIDYENREPLPQTDESAQDQKSAEATSTDASSQDTSASGTDDSTGPESGIKEISQPPVEKSQSDDEGSEEGEQADAYEGEVLKANAENIYLTKHISTDLPGSLYTTSNDDYPVVKVFDRNERSEAQEQKLIAMVNNPPQMPSGRWEKSVVLQWPSTLVYDYNNDTFLGCAFATDVSSQGRTIDGFARSGDSDQSLGSRVGSLFNNFRTACAGPGSSRYNTAIDLAAAVNTLHQQGVAICDFDPQNIIVTDSGLMFTSCDRYGLDDGSQYHTESGSHERYTPKSESGDSIEEKQYTDRFGLAIHLYQLLLKGDHPFVSPDRKPRTESLLEKEQLKYYISKNMGGMNSTVQKEARRYADLPRMIRYQFEKCFIEGFDAPEERPSPREWVETLTDELG